VRCSLGGLGSSSLGFASGFCLVGSGLRGGLRGGGLLGRLRLGGRRG
jgi:hypothetical protein